jgi:rubrerythrin
MPFRNLLKTTPPEAVRSLDELFAIAQAMEHEAAQRYAELAARMRAEDNSELADLFERLALEEQRHESMVLNWSRQRLAKVPDPGAIRWELPETFDEETAAELASSRLINAYRALSMAVRNEERAFTLWSYIAAQAETAEIQEAAEKMAREELEHVSVLRRARRTAYHAGREGRPIEHAPSIGDLLAQGASLENRLADQLAELAYRLSGDDANRARQLAAQARQVCAASSAQDGRTINENLDAQAIAEQLVEIYLSVADRSRDETMVARAQTLARQAIARLTWLRHFT